ncbi:hypothetical protein DFH06DRAFT_1145243 [Mycena polygramma]|nr:hypothetical protein DFH06DRAFT_1145243 [Mycena polygramma]
MSSALLDSVAPFNKNGDRIQYIPPAILANTHRNAPSGILGKFLQMLWNCSQDTYLCLATRWTEYGQSGAREPAINVKVAGYRVKNTRRNRHFVLQLTIQWTCWVFLAEAHRYLGLDDPTNKIRRGRGFVGMHCEVAVSSPSDIGLASGMDSSVIYRGGSTPRREGRRSRRDRGCRWWDCGRYYGLSWCCLSRMANAAWGESDEVDEGKFSLPQWHWLPGPGTIAGAIRCPQPRNGHAVIKIGLWCRYPVIRLNAFSPAAQTVL